MADLKIEEARARRWVAEVKSEIAQTRDTLDKVRNIRNEMPGDGDTLFDLIDTTCKKMEEVWTYTCDKFEKGWDALEKGLDVFSKAGTVITDTFNELIIK